ncbi:MAG: hypothetical protein HYZ16_07235 [Bacteroidetes bacterium]|jgi:hypothetical protein|nr:hypothetical protein [Bacteroidota bacterium]
MVLPPSFVPVVVSLAIGAGLSWSFGLFLDPQLTDPDKVLPSEATFHGVDIGLRINYFYFRVGVFLLGALGFYALFGAWLSRIGKVLWVRRLLQLAAAAVGIYIGLKLLFYNPNHYPAATWYWLLALGAIFLWSVTWGRHQGYRPLLQPVVGLLGAVLSLLIAYQGSAANLAWTVLVLALCGALYRFSHVVWMGYALAPMLALLSVELGHSLWLSPLGMGQVLVFGLGMLLLVIAIRFSLVLGLLHRSPGAQWNFLLAATIVSLGAMVYCQTGYVDHYELFENANPANSYLRVFGQGEWPLFEFLSSHLLSEQLPAYLHYALFGHKDEPVFLRYAQVWLVFAPLVAYLFLARVFQSPTWAFLLVLMFPFVPFLFPARYFYAIISAFLLFNWLNHQSKSRTALGFAWWSWPCVGFCLWLAFLVIWRIDLAAAILPSVVLLVVVGAASGFIHKQRPIQLVVVVLVLALFGILTFMWANMYFQHSLPNRVFMALDYFGASQAHGYANISGSWNPLFVDLHYHWMPLLVAAVALGLVWVARIRCREKPDFLIISAIFLGFFYFFNAPRGLVRHGLVEGSDAAIGSFAALTIILALIRGLPRTLYPFAVAGLMAICVLMSKIGQAEQAVPLLSQALARIPSFESPPAEYTLSSIGAERKIPVDSVVHYLDNQLLPDETFIDFSNSPMLYFYANRSVPSYFNQSLQNLPTIEGQLLALPYFDYRAMPIAIVRHFPESWWDHTDGVPNSIRYPVIAKYIYEHYLPCDTIGGYEIWMAKQRLLDSTATSAISPQSWDLMWYPNYLGVRHKDQLDGSGRAMDLEAGIKAPAIGDVIGVQVGEGNADSWLELAYFASGAKMGSIRFNIGIPPGKYLVPIWAQPNWWLAPADSLGISGPGSDRIDNVVLHRHAGPYPNLD